MYNDGMPRLVKKVKTKFESLSDSAQRLAAVVSAVLVVTGVIHGSFVFMVNQLDAHLDEQTIEIKKEIEDVKLSTTRNELLIMIKTEPKNVLGIERLAKHYFVDLKGDLYMTGMYSEWAHQYGGDVSFVVYHD